MVSYTNDAMQSRGLRLTTRGGILKFFGVLILMTRIAFGSRRSLWSSQGSSKYCSTIPYCNHPAEMIAEQEDGCYCSERAYTHPPPCTVVPQGTDVGQPVAAGVATGHTWYNR